MVTEQTIHTVFPGEPIWQLCCTDAIRQAIRDFMDERGLKTLAALGECVSCDQSGLSNLLNKEAKYAADTVSDFLVEKFSQQGLNLWGVLGAERILFGVTPSEQLIQDFVDYLKKRQWTRTDFAKKTGSSWPNVDRLIKGKFQQLNCRWVENFRSVGFDPLPDLPDLEIRQVLTETGWERAGQEILPSDVPIFTNTDHFPPGVRLLASRHPVKVKDSDHQVFGTRSEHGLRFAVSPDCFRAEQAVIDESFKEFAAHAVRQARKSIELARAALNAVNQSPEGERAKLRRDLGSELYELELSVKALLSEQPMRMLELIVDQRQELGRFLNGRKDGQ